MIASVGKSTPKIEGPDKVTGRAIYTPDVNLPGALWGKVLHSAVAHARIVSIDTSEARKLPGVHAVITGEDVGSGQYGMFLKDIAVLAKGRVRYAGEPVAAVAAEDLDTAKAALDLIAIDFEDLPAVFDVAEAMSPDAPILHPDFNSYPGVGVADVAGLPRISALERPSNEYHRTTILQGDLEAGFAAADLIVENRFVTKKMHQAYLEPQNALVWINDAGRVEAYVSTKVPHQAKGSLAFAAGIEAAEILVHHSYLGGDFGGKLVPLNLPICYELTKASGRPVRLGYDYIEEFLAGSGRHEVVVNLRTGVKRDGTITAHEVDFVVNSGAYAGYKPAGTVFGAAQSAGVYRVDNCRIRASHVYTNTVPGGYMRAPGEAQAYFAVESHMDDVARRIGMDPLDFRLHNLIREGEATGGGRRPVSIRAKETLLAAAEAAQYRTSKGPRTGRGIAMGERAPGGGEGHASVTLRPDGEVVIGTPVFDQGTGTYTVMSQIVSEELQVPIQRIRIDVWDTDAVANDSGVAADRATRINSSVAYDAVREAKRLLLEQAAIVLECGQEALSFRDGRVWRSDLEESSAWEDVLLRAGAEVCGKADYKDSSWSPLTSFCAQIAEVSVDPETGEVKLTNFTTAHDVGKVLNPLAHQGQINGGVVQGFGYALMEELLVQDGRVSTLSFGDYKIPTMADLPSMNTVLLEDGGGMGPYLVKGIGEPPTGPVAPAIANAIADAVGVRVHDLPLTSEKVFRALQARAAGEAST